MESDLALSIPRDSELTLKLKKEFQQIKQDRDDLRNIILKRYQDERIHIGVNV